MTFETEKRLPQKLIILLTENSLLSFFFSPRSLTRRLLTQDTKNNVDADLVMLEELKVKCRTQTEQIMAWKKAYSMQVIEFYFSWRKQTKWKNTK
jgi:hypothetical protein